jgi:hypothetical protein
VGGHAVGFHGHPRFTGDMDFFIERSEENAAKIEKVVADFGFAGMGLTKKDFLDPDAVIQLGRPPNRIDLLTSIDGVKFEEAWQTRIETRFGDCVAFIIAKDLLLRNKQAVGRPQDVADVEKLLE